MRLCVLYKKDLHRHTASSGTISAWALFGLWLRTENLLRSQRLEVAAANCTVCAIKTKIYETRAAA